MDSRSLFCRHKALAVRGLSCVSRRKSFALKGGTSIKLSLRRLPRRRDFLAGYLRMWVAPGSFIYQPCGKPCSAVLVTLIL